MNLQDLKKSYEDGSIKGWQPHDLDSPRLIQFRTSFYAAAPHLKESGEGKNVVLQDFVNKIVGHELCHLQTIGDCVSHGWSLCVDVLKCVQIATGHRESFEAETATEVTYAGSRQVGHQLGNWDGSTGGWAAKWAIEYGFLLRKVYKDGSREEDLTTYDGKKAAKWAASPNGVPDWLEPLAKEHPVKETALVRSYKEARDAIANGYPVPVCSNIGFSDVRDSEGFAKPGPRWDHCMSFIGVRDGESRKGLLCHNSWGPNWISGPKSMGQPEGSFWVDDEVADKMLRQEDSYAISGFVGYPGQANLDYYLI